MDLIAPFVWGGSGRRPVSEDTLKDLLGQSTQDGAPTHPAEALGDRHRDAHQPSCSSQPSPELLLSVAPKWPRGRDLCSALGAGSLGKPVGAQQELRVPGALGGTPLLLLAPFVMRQKVQGNAAGTQTDLPPPLSQGRGTYTMTLTSPPAQVLQLLKWLLWPCSLLYPISFSSFLFRSYSSSPWLSGRRNSWLYAQVLEISPGRGRAQCPSSRSHLGPLPSTKASVEIQFQAELEALRC